MYIDNEFIYVFRTYDSFAADAQDKFKKVFASSGSSIATNETFTGWGVSANAGNDLAKRTTYSKHTRMMLHCNPVKQFTVSSIYRYRVRIIL